MKKHNWKAEPWTPDADWQSHLPDVSGNEINGLGETDRRRPTQVFWHRRPTDQPFAATQRAVTERFNSIPALDAVYRNAERGPRKRSDPAPERGTECR